jgi:methionyl-tRNA formyltransferase
VAEAARGLGLPVLAPEDVNGSEACAAIAAERPDVLCLCAFGALIREPLLSAHSMLNVHPSLLPRWRGAAPVERALMAGDAETGVSIMRVGAGLDDGPVCLAASEPIGADDSYGSVAARLKPLGAELLVRALRESPPFVEQDDARATYAAKIGPEDRRLDARRPAVELERRVRALHPHIGARLELPDGSALGIQASRVGADIEVPPGALEGRDGRLLLGCSTGTLELLIVRPAGGRPMPADAYLRGHGSVLGARGSS